jgi:hypothetical protein
MKISLFGMSALLTEMFFGAFSFHYDISKWDVANVKDIPKCHGI